MCGRWVREGVNRILLIGEYYNLGSERGRVAAWGRGVLPLSAVTLEVNCCCARNGSLGVLECGCGIPFRAVQRQRRGCVVVWRRLWLEHTLHHTLTTPETAEEQSPDGKPTSV